MNWKNAKTLFNACELKLNGNNHTISRPYQSIIHRYFVKGWQNSLNKVSHLGEMYSTNERQKKKIPTQ